MKSPETPQEQGGSSVLSGVFPFHVNEHGFVEDATGARVLVCSEDTECPMRFNERAVDSDGHFMCPNCGRLGQRMVEARPDQCGLQPNTGDDQRRSEA